MKIWKKFGLRIFIFYLLFGVVLSVLAADLSEKKPRVIPRETRKIAALRLVVDQKLRDKAKAEHIMWVEKYNK